MFYFKVIGFITLFQGHNVIRSDNPSDSKEGGVCIYYKEHIPLILRDDTCTSPSNIRARGLGL